MTFSPAEILGSFGVGILLIAFVLNVRGTISRTSRAYGLANAIGAGMACAAAIYIRFLPFVVLEGAWCLASVVQLLKRADLAKTKP